MQVSGCKQHQVKAPGEIPVTQAEIDAFNQIPVNTDLEINQGIGVRVGDTGPVVAPGEAPAEMDEFNQEQQNTLQNILNQAGQTVKVHYLHLVKYQEPL